MIVSAGHAEYLPQAPVGVTITEIWPPGDAFMDFDATDEEAAAAYEKQTGNEADPDVDYTWAVIIEIHGTPNHIGDWLTLLCRELVVTPSGDDDTFDYWPSGCRLAAAVAAELGDPWPERVRLAVATGLVGIDASIQPELRDRLGVEVPG